MFSFIKNLRVSVRQSFSKHNPKVAHKEKLAIVFSELFCKNQRSLQTVERRKAPTLVKSAVNESEVRCTFYSDSKELK